MMHWEMKHSAMRPELIPEFLKMLDEDDPRPAREQLDTGGGWDPFKGFTMLPNGNIKYLGDPPTLLLAETKLRDETLRFYNHSWVAIIQKDGSFEVCRMD